MGFKAYPKHIYHPSMDENGFREVQNETEHNTLLRQDEAWRDKPYSEAEKEEWLKENEGMNEQRPTRSRKGR